MVVNIGLGGEVFSHLPQARLKLLDLRRIFGLEPQLAGCFNSLPHFFFQLGDIFLTGKIQAFLYLRQ